MIDKEENWSLKSLPLDILAGIIITLLLIFLVMKSTKDESIGDIIKQLSQ